MAEQVGPTSDEAGNESGPWGLQASDWLSLVRIPMMARSITTLLLKRPEIRLLSFSSARERDTAAVRATAGEARVP